MSKHFLIAILFVACIVLTFDGCISSEETGAGDRAKTPLQILGQIDTTRRMARRDTIANIKIDSTKLLKQVKQQRPAPKFKSKQDTIQASVIMKAKPVLHPNIKIERPENPNFTVQIGAFANASNALRAQKKAKDRFSNQPVFNNYVRKAKLYRVSVGRCEDRKSALILSDTLKQSFPKEYQQCWINYIQ